MYVTYEYIQWDVQRDSKQQEAIQKLEDLEKIFTSQKASFERELKVLEESLAKKKDEHSTLQQKISSQNALIDTQEEKVKTISDLNNSIIEKSSYQKKLVDEIQVLEKEKNAKSLSIESLNEKYSILTQEEKSIVEAH